MLTPDRAFTLPAIGSNTYFITITLKPKLYKYSSGTQFDISKPEVDKLLYSVYEYVSVAEMTVEGNCHWHAICRFSNDLNRIRFIDCVKKNRTLGYIKVTPKPVDSKESLDRAFQYMKKDVSTTTSLLHTANYKPIVLSDHYMNPLRNTINLN